MTSRPASAAAHSASVWSGQSSRWSYSGICQNGGHRLSVVLTVAERIHFLKSSLGKQQRICNRVRPETPGIVLPNPCTGDRTYGVENRRRSQSRTATPFAVSQSALERDSSSPETASVAATPESAYGAPANPAPNSHRPDSDQSMVYPTNVPQAD